VIGAAVDRAVGFDSNLREAGVANMF